MYKILDNEVQGQSQGAEGQRPTLSDKSDDGTDSDDSDLSLTVKGDEK